MSDKQSDPNEDKKQPKHLSNKRSYQKADGLFGVECGCDVWFRFCFGAALRCDV